MRKLLLPFIFLLGLVGCGGGRIPPNVTIDCKENIDARFVTSGPFYSITERPIGKSDVEIYNIDTDLSNPEYCRTTYPVVSQEDILFGYKARFNWIGKVQPQVPGYDLELVQPLKDAPIATKKYLAVWHWNK
jgi:hypothetical protein